jgi:large subunit ribosomal protein L21
VVYAIFKSGGRQYRVAVGETIEIGRLNAKAGEQVKFDEVLLLGGEKPVVDPAALKGASVTATVVAHTRGVKQLGMKYKPKKFYRRKVGSREDLTRVQVSGINTP